MFCLCFFRIRIVIVFVLFSNLRVIVIFFLILWELFFFVKIIYLFLLLIDDWWGNNEVVCLLELVLRIIKFNCSLLINFLSSVL